MRAHAVIGLGSNVGDRAAMISSAIARIASARGVQLEKSSPLYQTDPIGGPEQPPFINGAVLVSNDNWMDDPAQAAIANTYGLGLSDGLESVVVATLPPGPYTALLAGSAGGTGIGLVELYSNPQALRPIPVALDRSR